MQNEYGKFLDYRAAQRALAARFARPRWLLLHTGVFVTAITAIWAYGTAWRLWYYQQNFALPVLIGVVWSAVLAAHALVHYWRSSAHPDARERAVEETMRGLIERQDAPPDDDGLFALHHQLEGDLEQRGRWSLALLAFALVNLASWGVSAFNVGTSWPFQMTLPLAVIIIGGINMFLHWQVQRGSMRVGWFTRLPLRHIAVCGVGVVCLGIAGMHHMINYWDVDNFIKGWGFVLLLHILWNVVLAPLVQPREETEKGKPSLSRLALVDDGEMIDMADLDEGQRIRRHGSG